MTRRAVESRQVMLVAVNSAPGGDVQPKYLALWEGGGTMLYYVGPQPPAYSTTPPATVGWSGAPPQ